MSQNKSEVTSTRAAASPESLGTGVNETAPNPDKSQPADRPAFGPPAQPGEIGRLGKYRIAQELGRGGMGAVYLAFDERLQRKVALKVMLPKAASNATAKDRFLREARAAAQISSDYVVNIYEADEIDHVPYIALQYLKGYPLDEYLKKKGNLDVSQAVRIGREIALGLAAAHDLGLIHRDIKPGNIWLEAPNGRVKILDFGLAKPVHASDGPEITASGTIMGTPAYMAPEQGMGQPVDGRADLFSLGCLLYRLVTGRLPFDRPTIMAVLTAISTEHPDPVTTLNPNVPQQLADVIHRLLAKKPAQRPPNAQAVADLLAALAQTNTDGAAPPVVYYAPAAVSVQQSNPFADIVDTATEVRPTAKPRAATPKASTSKKKPMPWLLIGSILGFLAVSVLAGVIIIKITNKDGTVTEIKVPEGTKVEVNGKNVTPTLSPPSPSPPSPGVATPGLPWVPIPLGESPFDKLDPNAIPKEERFDWQPKELVAVIGSHARRHWGFVNCAAISPDGKLAASHSSGRMDSLIVWDMENRQAKWVINVADFPHAGSVTFSPDSRHLFVVQYDRFLDFDLIGENPKRTEYSLTEKDDKPFDWQYFHLCEGGNTLLVHGWGDTLGLFDLTSGKPQRKLLVELMPLPGNLRAKSSLAVAAERSLIVYRDKTGKLHRATIKNANLVDDANLPIPLESNDSMRAIRDDGKVLAIWGKDGLDLWDTMGDQPKKTISIPATVGINQGSEVVLSPDGRWLSAYQSNTPVLLQIGEKDAKLMARLDDTAQGGGTLPQFSSDGNKLIVGSGNGFVRFWDLAGQEPKELSPFDPATAFPIPHRHRATSLDAKQGRLMLPRFDTQEGKRQRNQLWDLGGTQPKPLAFLDSSIYGPVHLLGQNRAVQIAVFEHASRFYRQNGADFESIGEPFGSQQTLGTVSPDGRTMVVYSPADANPKQLVAWDLSGDVPKSKWSITPKEQELLGGNGGGKVWFSADNRWFATQAKVEKADGPWKLVLWRNTGAKPEVHATLPISLNSGQYRAAFSPDGRYLAHSPTGADEIVLLDLTGKAPREAGRFTDGLKMGCVFALAFHPDSKKLAVGSDRGVCLLDVATMKPIYDWQSPGPVHWLDWAADGRHLVTHNGNKTVYVLRMQQDHVVEQAPPARAK